MKHHNSLNRQAIGLIAALVLMYLLGMATTLFVSFPEDQTASQWWDFAMAQPVVLIHMILGLLIFLGAISLWVGAVRAKHRIWKIAASIGLVSTLVALGAGERTVSTQSDIYSYIMAVGFLVALLGYGWGIYKSSATN